MQSIVLYRGFMQSIARHRQEILKPASLRHGPLKFRTLNLNNEPLFQPKYPLFKTRRPPFKGTWGAGRPPHSRTPESARRSFLSLPIGS